MMNAHPPVEECLLIAITGHRPGDLRRDGERIDLAPVLHELLARAVRRAQASNRRVRFITGGALGVDQAVAAMAREMRQTGPHGGVAIEYSVELPFPLSVMTHRWSEEQRDHLTQLLNAADYAPAPLAEAFEWSAYQRRNEQMIDAAEIVIAFWNGKKKGGTYNAIRYACRATQQKPVYNALNEFRLLSV